MSDLSFIDASVFNQETVAAFATTHSDDQIFDLAERYDSRIGESDAKKQGSFYTPRALVELMTQNAFNEYREQPRAIADISCGSGIFLLESLRLLSSRFKTAPSINLSSIYGVDRDIKALKAAQLLLAAYAIRDGVAANESIEIVSRNLRFGNALIAPEEVSEKVTGELKYLLHPFSWSQDYSQIIELNGGFDIIIGNPPYGLSRSDRIDSLETEILRELYLPKHGGKINTYILFILRAYSLLAPQGIISFVVPNAWLGIDEAKSIRKLLIDSSILTHIDYFEVSPFRKLGVEVVTFIIKKSAESKVLKIRTLRSIETPSVIAEARIPHTDIAKDDCYRISLTSSSKRIALIRRIEEAGTPLKSLRADFKASVGLQAYARGRGEPPQTAEDVAMHPFHSMEKIGENSVRYLEGKDISPFKISWRGHFLEYGPWLAECPPKSHYQVPRIVLREILGRFPRFFQAAVVRESFVYNRSILHILPLNQVAESRLNSLAVILNSTVAGFWLWQRGRKSQRKLFPKIVTHDLNDFPIPALSDDVVSSLNQLYEQMNLAHQENNNEELSALYSILDARVAALYQVDITALASEIESQ